MTGNNASDGEPTVGSMLVRLRTAARLSQEELAERAGVSVRTVRNIERGAVSRPWPDSVRRLAEALELDDDERARFEAIYRDGRPMPAPAADVIVPHQLPLDVDRFHGRSPELAALDALLDRPRGSAVTIAAVVGTGGVGKTALVVHWAHRVAARFPDGQLWVDLRGYDPDQPVAPHAALAGFVRALGVDPERVPADPAELEALYRSLLASRRLLVVLDNARDADHVRPLLPGSSSCLVLVTSRDDLGGLVVRHGAHRIDLDALPASEAVALLTSLIGERAEGDADAVRQVADRCARLPLALRIAAEFAIAHPAQSVAEVAENLADAQHRLDVLEVGGDPRAAVRAVFAWSYDRLDPQTARLFRLLGLHPGADLDGHAAAALAELDLRGAERMLDRLVRAHLLAESARTRFTMHDLLRDWASERVQAEDGDTGERAALQRLFDYYRCAAFRAVSVYAPGSRLPDEPTARTPIPEFGDRADALQWLDRESANLVRVAVLAADHGFPRYPIDLSEILNRYLDYTGRGDEADVLHGLACRVAEGTDRARSLNRRAMVRWHRGRLDETMADLREMLRISREVEDRSIEAAALTGIGNLHRFHARYRDAFDYTSRALTIYQALNDDSGRGATHSNLGIALSMLGKHDEALGHFAIALDIARSRNDRLAESHAIGNLGCIYERLDRLDDAWQHGQTYLAMSREMGQRDCESDALNNLGAVHRRRRQWEEALDSHQQALAIARDINRPMLELDALIGAGEAWSGMGDPDQARDFHQRALRLASHLGHRHALARAHEGLATAFEDLGEAAVAREHRRSALELYDGMGGVPEVDRLREHVVAERSRDG